MQLQPFFDRKQQTTLVLVAPVATIWAAVLVDWLWVLYLPFVIQYVMLALLTLASGAWLAVTAEQYGTKNRWFYLVASITFPVFWQFSLYNCDHFGQPLLRVSLAWFGLASLFLIGLAWTVWGVERIAQQIEAFRRQQQEFDLQSVLQKKRRRTSVQTWNPFDPAAWKRSK